ncbi:MAG: hypothetical protein WBO77_03895 [Microgenomates group bacterium]
MKLLLMDLDDTLIDTALFKQALFQKLASVYDIDIEQVLQVYEDFRSKLDMDDWIYDFTMAFDQEVWFSTKDLERMGLPIVAHKEMVEFVKKFTGTKIIFSLGNIKLQKQKIELAQLKNLFNSIIITNKSKIDALKAWSQDGTLVIDNVRYDEVVLVDDNEPFLENVRELFPWITTLNPKQMITKSPIN